MWCRAYCRVMIAQGINLRSWSQLVRKFHKLTHGPQLLHPRRALILYLFILPYFYYRSTVQSIAWTYKWCFIYWASCFCEIKGVFNQWKRLAGIERACYYAGSDRRRPHEHIEDITQLNMRCRLLGFISPNRHSRREIGYLQHGSVGSNQNNGVFRLVSCLIPPSKIDILLNNKYGMSRFSKIWSTKT